MMVHNRRGEHFPGSRESVSADEIAGVIGRRRARSLKTTFVDNQRAFSILLLQLALAVCNGANGFDARYYSRGLHTVI